MKNTPMGQLKVRWHTHATFDGSVAYAGEIYGAATTGVRLATLLQMAGARPEVKHMIFHSADGTYVDQLTVKDALLPGMMLAYHINGQPLLREGGYPVRLIVPPMYGYKSVKWVTRVVLAAEGVVGTWERYGYADAAWLSG